MPLRATILADERAVMTRLHLSPTYAVGINYEVVSEAITNEIAWQFARAYEHSIDTAPAQPYLAGIDELESAPSILRVDGPGSVALDTRFVRALRAMHSHDVRSQRSGR